MNIVITMAGLGSRFKKAGYKLPKYKIVANGKTLFEWSMQSLTDFKSEKHIFIVRKEDDAKKFILEKCNKLKIKNFFVLEIDFLTKGQAETAMLAVEKLNKDDSLMIYNIDTYVESDQIKYDFIKGEGFIPCFEASGDHWSFVKTNEMGLAAEVCEKKRISNNCTIGAYYFNSAKLYMDLYNEYYLEESNKNVSERYIAPIYNLLIKKKGKVYIQIIPSKYIHVLGTPRELNDFIEETKQS